MADNLAEYLIKDIADEGLAELATADSLRSLDGETILEVEQEDDTIWIYENGENIAELDTTTDGFNGRFMHIVATSLNF